jgi:hypothetical protein
MIIAQEPASRAESVAGKSGVPTSRKNGDKWGALSF